MKVQCLEGGYLLLNEYKKWNRVVGFVLASLVEGNCSELTGDRRKELFCLFYECSFLRKSKLAIVADSINQQQYLKAYEYAAENFDLKSYFTDAAKVYFGKRCNKCNEACNFANTSEDDKSFCDNDVDYEKWFKHFFRISRN